MRAFIFHMSKGVETPWSDISNTFNVIAEPNLGYHSTLNIKPYPVKARFFEKVDTRHVLTKGITSDLCLIKPYTTDEFLPPIAINLEDIANLFNDKSIDRVIFGAPLDLVKTQPDAATYTRYFSRTKDGNMFDHTDNVVIDSDVNIIPWFCCFKTTNLPFYYIVINPNAIQWSADAEGTFGENFVGYLDDHLGNLSDAFFKPSVSRNAKVIGDQIIVKGDKLTLTAFDTWFNKKHLPGFFDSSDVKCSTNFKYTRDGNTFNFDLTDHVGYITLRWNSATVMHTTFMNSRSRFLKEYVIHVIKE